MFSLPKLCLVCEKPIKGRTDKKFCDDTCRNNYNNLLKADSNNIVRNIRNALARNRRILESFLPGDAEMEKVSRETLLLAGFQFKYITHITTNKKGTNYFFCFDHGYLLLDNESCLIVKAKSC